MEPSRSHPNTALTRRRFLALTGAATVGSTVPLGAGLSGTAGDGPFGIADRVGWRLRVGGEVAEPALLNLIDDLLSGMPSRFVTSWLVAGEGRASLASWEGYHLSTIVRKVRPDPAARWVHVHCADGHHDSFALADLLRPRALFAHTREGHLLDAPQGGPLRLVIPWRLAERSVVAIERIEFHREPLSGTDPLAGALPQGERVVRGVASEPHSAWTPQVGEIEAPLQVPGEAVPEWEVFPNPGPPDDGTDALGRAQALGDASFLRANYHRTHLIRSGESGLAALDPRLIPPHQPGLDERISRHNVLAEVDSPQATEWTLQGLADPAPEVRAMCLDTAARRVRLEALHTGEAWATDADDAVALTAVAAVAALAPPGDPTALDALSRAEANASDPACRAEIDRALTRLQPG